MIALLLAAIVFSTTLLFLLCRGDPKRRRSIRLPGKAQGSTARRLLSGASLLPGVGFAVAGNAAAVLIWLGGYAVAGWLVTLLLSEPRRSSRQADR